MLHFYYGFRISYTKYPTLILLEVYKGRSYLGDGVQRSGSVVPGGRWDHWANRGRDSWGSDGDGVLVGPGLSGDVGVSWGLLDRLSGDDVLVAVNNLLGSDLETRQTFH